MEVIKDTAEITLKEIWDENYSLKQVECLIWRNWDRIDHDFTNFSYKGEKKQYEKDRNVVDKWRNEAHLNGDGKEQTEVEHWVLKG